MPERLLSRRERLAVAAPAGGAMLLAALACAPAAAQTRLDASASLASDDVFRGRSLSGGRAVGSATLALERPDGPYAGASISGLVGQGGGPEPVDVQEYGGYAHRLDALRTVDVGVVNEDYPAYDAGRQARRYTEFHAGFSEPGFAVQLHLSPDYFASGRRIAYVEADAVPFTRGSWALGAHAGLLVGSSPRGRTDDAYPNGYDWRVALSRRFGRFRLEGAVTGVGPAPDDKRVHEHAVVKLSFGV